MTAFLEHFETFEFKVARLHFPPPDEHYADFVIQLDTELLVPFSPQIDRAFG